MVKRKVFLNCFNIDNTDSGDIGGDTIIKDIMEKKPLENKRDANNLSMDYQQIQYLLKKITINEKIFKEFSGSKGEDPQEYLNQFELYKEEWSDEKLLIAIRSSLKGRPLKWYEAMHNEEIKCWNSFTVKFKANFLRKSEEKEDV
ncbi:hypothetical protein H311_01579, partial [Anncaliia algerae PRA109]